MTKTKIMYMELKKDESHNYNDRGEARIGRVTFSKSGRSIIYKGKMFLRTRDPAYANYIDAETREVYWISGPKKDGTDRYYWGKTAPVLIDEDVREEYWTSIRKKPERVQETRF